jgi:hypothetical protein
MDADQGKLLDAPVVFHHLQRHPGQGSLDIMREHNRRIFFCHLSLLAPSN